MPSALSSLFRPDPIRRPSGHARSLSTASYLPLSHDDDDPDDNGDAEGAEDEPESSTPKRPVHVRETSHTPLLVRRTSSRSPNQSLTLGERRRMEKQLAHSPDASLASDGAPLTPTQKKMAIVARSLEETGMGRYQWSIFALCGFGYALDLMWAYAFGLIAPRIQQEFGIPDANYGDIFSIFSAGLTVGALTWGILVDIIGRKLAFNMTVGIAAVAGIFIGVPNSWAVICFLTFFVGFGLGGNIPIDATIVLEFIPPKHRYLLAALSVFQPIGGIITSVISWGLIPKYACEPGLPSCRLVPSGTECCTKASNYGWRYAMFTIGGISICAFIARFFLFDFCESPRFLVSKGRDAEAVTAVHAVARLNGRTSALALEQLEACDALDAPGHAPSHARAEAGRGAAGVLRQRARQVSFYHLALLFSTPKMARLTILTWLVYAGDYWGFTIAGSFLPKILAERGAAAEQSTYETYRNYIIIACVGVPGVIAGAALIEVPRFGRKWAMVLSSALMGASCFLYARVTTPAASVGFNAMEYFFQSMFNAILYGWTPEAFPSAVRGSAAGLASFWGRLASIVAPLVAAHVATLTALYLAGAGVFLCTVLALFLPDTRHVDVL